jgi:hypothetical protein
MSPRPPADAHGEEEAIMLSLAVALVIAGVACIVRDGYVNGPSYQVRRAAAAERIQLERMFALPARLPS